MSCDWGESNEIADDRKLGMQSGRSLNPFLLRCRCCRPSVVIIIILAVFDATQAHMIRAIKQRDVVLTRCMWFLLIHPWFNKKLKNIIWDKIIYKYQSLFLCPNTFPSIASHRNRNYTAHDTSEAKPSPRRPAWHSTHSIHYKRIARIAQRTSRCSLEIETWLDSKRETNA